MCKAGQLAPGAGPWPRAAGVLLPVAFCNLTGYWPPLCTGRGLWACRCGHGRARPSFFALCAGGRAGCLPQKPRRARTVPRGFLFSHAGRRSGALSGRAPARQRAGPEAALGRAFVKGGMPYGFGFDTGSFLTLARQGPCLTGFPSLDTCWRLAWRRERARQSTLLRLLAGALAPTAGHIAMPCTAVLFPSACQMAKCVRMRPPNICFLKPRAGPLRGRPGCWVWQKRRWAGRWPPFRAARPPKCCLAMLFAGEERFLLLDEPTNHLDEPRARPWRPTLPVSAGLLWPRTTARC